MNGPLRLKIYQNGKRRRSRYESILVMVAAAVLLALVVTLIIRWTSAPVKGHLVTEYYTVQDNDTLWGIAGRYMVKNTCGIRNIREFQHSILQANYDLFRDRVPGLIRPGDILQINYWVKEDNQ
jgi:hypothetical protein